MALASMALGPLGCGSDVKEGTGGSGSSGTLVGSGSSAGDSASICALLGDPANCYRTFAQDVGAECGAVGEGTAPQGTFQARDDLSTCILQTQNGAAYQGGQIIFEPALDLAGAGDRYTIKLIRNDGASCGFVRFASTYDFSVTIAPHDDFAGASYEQGTSFEGDDLLVTCPDLEDFFFTQAEVDECPEYAALVPQARLDVNPGSLGINGVVRLSVSYPPPSGALEGAEPYDVEYFECIIPAPPGPCEDGLQNGVETDVDCGGAECFPRCEDNQRCLTDLDCRDGLSCVLVEGFTTCRE